MKEAIRFATTPTLEIAYEQTGSDSGKPVLLLHGFPYDVRVFDGVREQLLSSGLRLIVPYLRGYGPTRFHAVETMRSGQQAALGKDVVDLLDALQIQRATLVGFDWGGRAACVAAALWPNRVQGLVAMPGYDIQDIAGTGAKPQDPEQEERYWYQWYFHTERGRAGLAQYRAALARRLWQLWSPSWPWDETLFAATLPSFDNPSFVDVAIQSYRHRYGNAPGDPALEEWEQRLAGQPKISVPTIALHGADDGVQPPKSSAGKEAKFTAFYERRVLPGVGHCPPMEAPREVARAIKDLRP